MTNLIANNRNHGYDPVPWAVNYEAILAAAVRDTNRAPIGFLEQELPHVWRDAYLAMQPRPTNIVHFHVRTFEYFYDHTTNLRIGVGADSVFEIEARLVAVYGRSCMKTGERDDYRLKGWLGGTERTFGRYWDKGHFIAHSIGGAVDGAEVNVFPQRRDLNRGWSAAGKRYREMERYCETHSGTFCFSRPIYEDQSVRPSMFEFGFLSVELELCVECFENRL